MRALSLTCLILSGVACRPTEPPIVRLATTTSVENSGLLSAILPEFERAGAIRIQVLAVGSGRALQLIAHGDADAGLTHDPDAEAGALQSGTIADYRKVMFNDFVLVGPPGDSAAVHQAPTVTDAMIRIVRHGALFVSRGDSSGTH